jgi:hypothetical protein
VAGVNEAIVREYFESLGFLVHQPRKYVVMARSKRPEEEVDLIVVNPQLAADVAAPPGDQMVLGGAELRRLARAVVSVRGWHTDRFSPAILELSPEIFRFADDQALKGALRLLGPGPVTKVLCLPALPTSPSLKKKALEMLREKGVDAVILFPTMLRELMRDIEVSKNYEKSDLLQTLRILKNYDLLRDEQLELFRKRPARARDPGTPAA